MLILIQILIVTRAARKQAHMGLMDFMDLKAFYTFHYQIVITRCTGPLYVRYRNLFLFFKIFIASMDDTCSMRSQYIQIRWNYLLKICNKIKILIFI